MKATGLSGIVPRGIFIQLNQDGCQKIEPIFFRAGSVKRPWTRPGNTF